MKPDVLLSGLTMVIFFFQIKDGACWSPYVMYSIDDQIAQLNLHHEPLAVEVEGSLPTREADSNPYLTRRRRTLDRLSSSGGFSRIDKRGRHFWSLSNYGVIPLRSPPGESMNKRRLDRLGSYGFAGIDKRGWGSGGYNWRHITPYWQQHDGLGLFGGYDSIGSRLSKRLAPGPPPPSYYYGQMPSVQFLREEQPYFFYRTPLLPARQRRALDRISSAGFRSGFAKKSAGTVPLLPDAESDDGWSTLVAYVPVPPPTVVSYVPSSGNTKRSLDRIGSGGFSGIARKRRSDETPITLFLDGVVGQRQRRALPNGLDRITSSGFTNFDTYRPKFDDLLASENDNSEANNAI